MISGPAPSTTVAMAIIVTAHASTLSEALAVVILSGLIQIVLGLSKLGRFVVYTPYVVVSGFMSGVGIIMITMQALPYMGSPVVQGGSLDVLRAIPEAMDHVNVSAFAIATITLGVMIL